ncbi:MAG: YeeE/YedE family protein [Chryseotalea sp. WA131a]|nr:MAG: YeeE/YedE family protein [Chryseotalea sp. WA131a]
MRNLKYLFVGVFFGLVLTKGEAISWYRIQEMFRFESFHMFGIFMTAIPTGAILLLLIRKLKIKTLEGEEIEMPKKEYHHGIIIGSLLFGFGWALTGACPGPIYTQIGSGTLVAIVTLLSALAGTWCYGYFQKYLPD